MRVNCQALDFLFSHGTAPAHASDVISLALSFLVEVCLLFGLLLLFLSFPRTEMIF